MSILYKCACGHADVAVDEAAGRTVSCAKCGQPVTIPQESSPDCVLVYFNGSPDEGSVLLKEDFLERVEKFQLRENDLIWDDGMWKPLGEVYKLPAAPSRVQPIPVTSLVKSAKELPPVEPAPTKPGEEHVPVETDKPAKKQPAEAYKPEMKERVKLIVQLVFMLVVLFCGWFFGIGKIVNFALFRPGYLVVVNPTEQGVTMTCAGQESLAPAKGLAVFSDLFVSWKTKLSVKIMDEKGEAIRTIKAPVEPNVDYIYNTDKTLKFAVMDIPNLASEKVDDALLRNLANQIASHEVPDVGPIHRQILNKVEANVKGTTDELILSSKQYNLSQVGIVRSAEYMERRPKDKQKPNPLPVLMVYDGSRELSFRLSEEVYIMYKPGRAVNTLRLPVTFSEGFLPFQAEDSPEMKGKLALEPVKGKATLSYAQGEKNALQLNMSNQLPAKLTYNGAKYEGNWSYSSVGALQGGSYHWTWTWRFVGTANLDGGKRGSLTLTCLSSPAGIQKLTADYKELPAPNQQKRPKPAKK